MKSEYFNPWDKLQLPEGGLTVLRCDSASPHDFFWALNSVGEYCFVLEIDLSIARIVQGKQLDIAGVKLDIKKFGNDDSCHFMLILKQKADWEIFARLCIDVIEATQEITDTKVALEVLLTRIKRWRSFMAKKRRRLLGPREVRGLFGELEYLVQCLRNGSDGNKIVESWVGPLECAQDFVCEDTAVEVKTIHGTDRNTVKISSEAQLETQLDNLYLQVYRVSEHMDGSEGTSLNEKVFEIFGLLSNDVKGVFEDRLAEYGYIELPEYDKPIFKINSNSCYEVTDEFPCLKASALPEGVHSVEYKIKLCRVEQFSVDVKYI